MIFTPPDNITYRDFAEGSVFLAGSIEMGKAEPWQDATAEILDKRSLNVFNPRRADWDSSWKQEFSDPQFYQQVSWELDALEKSDWILLYFDPKTKSPISLLELGKFHHKMVCVCPEGYWRRGNVEIFCERYGTLMIDDINEAISFIINQLEHK